MKRLVKPVAGTKKKSVTNRAVRKATEGRSGTIEIAKMVTAAHRFYKDGAGQETIAAELGFSVKHVRRLLWDAWDLGLVSIEVNAPRTESIQTLETNLCSSFPHLQKVIIVPAGDPKSDTEYSRLLRRLASEAALYFDTLVDKDKQTYVSLSGGETLLEFAYALADRDRANVHFHASVLVGRGRLVNSSSIEPATTCTVAWSRSGRFSGHSHFATVPPYDPGIHTRANIKGEMKELASRKPIEMAIRDLDNVTVAVASLGLINPGEPTFRTTGFR